MNFSLCGKVCKSHSIIGSKVMKAALGYISLQLEMSVDFMVTVPTMVAQNALKLFQVPSALLPTTQDSIGLNGHYKQ